MSEFGEGGSRGLGQDAKTVGDRLGSQAADIAGRVAEKVGQGDLGQATSELKGAAGDIKEAALEHGKALLDSAREQATGFVDQRKNEAARSVADLAASLRETGRSFGDKPNINAFVGSAADGLEQLATGIQERSFAELYSQAEEYARRSPMTVAAVAAVTGFLLARFIKSTSEEMSATSANERASAARRASPGGSGQAGMGGAGMAGSGMGGSGSGGSGMDRSGTGGAGMGQGASSHGASVHGGASSTIPRADI